MSPKDFGINHLPEKIVDTEQLEKNFYVSPEDGYHVRIGSNEYFDILFDGNYKELNPNLHQKIL